jgi:hypothetical protein
METPDEFNVELTVHRLLRTKFKPMYDGTPPNIYIEDIVRLYHVKDRLKPIPFGCNVLFYKGKLKIRFEDKERVYLSELYEYEDYKKDYNEAVNNISDKDKIIRTLHFKIEPTINEIITPTPPAQTKSVSGEPINKKWYHFWK